MKLFHTEWCPECEIVRRKLADLGITFDEEIVPDVRPFRKSVYEVSGQYYVPVLADGKTVLTDTAEILAYLENYPANGAPTIADAKEMPNLSLGSFDERNT